MPKLSDARIRSAKPKSAPYKVFDTDGLFLSVQPSGAKWWRQRYRFAGKERLLSLGGVSADRACRCAGKRDRHQEAGGSGRGSR